MVIRVNRTKNYTVMSKYHLKEKEMSLKAKGLLSLMLSLPDDWDYSIDGLVTLSKDGKDSVMNALIELEKFKYLKRTKLTNEKGQFAGYDYDIYEKPYTENPQMEKPCSENPNTENPNTENPPQLNTNKLNTYELNTNELNKEKCKKEKPSDTPTATHTQKPDTSDISENSDSVNIRKRFLPPTLEEVQSYCRERKNDVDAQRFVDYYTSNGWLVGKNKMKDWKAAVRTWERNNTNSGKSGNIAVKKNVLTDLDDIF